MSLVTFNKLLCDMFGKVLRENKFIYLIGDFNVNILHDVPGGLSTQEFKNIFSTNYCFPLINIPTRVTMNSASLIDNMYSNFPAQGNVCDSGVLKTSISDHYAIFCIANNAVVNKTCTQSTRRSFCDRNIANFNIALINTSWDFIYNNADMQSLYTSFQRVIDRLINTHFKMESFTTNYKNRHPWLTGPLRSQIKAKNRMYAEAIASGSAELMDKYKKRKNEVLSLLKNTEIMYFSDQMEINKNDLNKTWKILRVILGKDRNPSAKNPTFKLDGKIISDRAAIANGFNNYFVSIGPKLASEISSNVNPISYVKNINNSIVIPNITCHEVYQVICSLKNSSAGWDDFPTFVLKKCSDSLLQPLTHLINCSLQSGIFPDELKLARVVPIFKAGDPAQVSNYRPISVLTTFSKIIENIVYNHLLDFLSKNEALYEYQFGFRPSHSTQQAIITLVDRITKSLDNGNFAVAILLDLKKAFDTVDHKILLKKLYAYGIRGIFLKWFESYLSGRTQYVVFDGVQSETHRVDCGVPQGSILGPLLFILNMNDICNVSKLMFTILYADDTCVLLRGTDLSKLIKLINSELNLLSTWFKSNKLSLNTGKTFYMVFHRARLKPNTNNDIIMDGNILTKVNSAKYLGVIIDHKLNWIEHIAYVKNKISKGIGIIYKARSVLSKTSLVSLYYSYVYPYLTYCIEAWGCAMQTHLLPLFLLQKKIIRLITFSPYLAHTGPIFLNLQLLPLEKIFFSRVGLVMFKCSNNMLPNVISNLYIKNNEIHSHFTRNSNLLRIPKGTPNFTTISARVWNEIVTKIIMDQHVSISKFKTMLKSYLLVSSFTLSYTK